MAVRMNPTVEKVLDRLSMMREGKFDLSWMQANPAGWHTRATPSVDGETPDELRARADYEEQALYEWADQHLDASERTSFFTALADALRRRLGIDTPT